MGLYSAAAVNIESKNELSHINESQACRTQSSTYFPSIWSFFIQRSRAFSYLTKIKEILILTSKKWGICVHYA